MATDHFGRSLSDVPGGEQGNHATVIGHDGTVPFHRAALTARRGESMGALESELGAHSWARLCSEALSTGSLSTQHVRGDAWRTGSRELPPHERRRTKARGLFRRWP